VQGPLCARALAPKRDRGTPPATTNRPFSVEIARPDGPRPELSTELSIRSFRSWEVFLGGVLKRVKGSARGKRMSRGRVTGRDTSLLPS
jgi:hypothetical protein